MAGCKTASNQAPSLEPASARAVTASSTALVSPTLEMQEQATVTPRNTETATPLAHLGMGDGHLVVYSPDGKFLAIGFANGIAVLDARTLQELKLIRSSSYVSFVLFSSDSRFLITSGSEEGTVEFRNVDDWSLARTMTIGSVSVIGAAVSPDGKLLATISDFGIYDQVMESLRRFPDSRALQQFLVYSVLGVFTGRNDAGFRIGGLYRAVVARRGWIRTDEIGQGIGTLGGGRMEHGSQRRLFPGWENARFRVGLRIYSFVERLGRIAIEKSRRKIFFGKEDKSCILPGREVDRVWFYDGEYYPREECRHNGSGGHPGGAYGCRLRYCLPSGWERAGFGFARRDSQDVEDAGRIGLGDSYPQLIRIPAFCPLAKASQTPEEMNRDFRSMPGSEKIFPGYANERNWILGRGSFSAQR